ncbi:hypothetical protein AVEN_119063-1 [Araneus ventricosus]|uniref:Uncharacterized protein n=1 Tax=Araneus ventricosus TaxID=182803 RepID=A0A4Y2BK64_ARAVE|nr:hypothetical protein AVEN_119063-1 [Araneus ventricosus]
MNNSFSRVLNFLPLTFGVLISSSVFSLQWYENEYHSYSHPVSKHSKKKHHHLKIKERKKPYPQYRNPSYKRKNNASTTTPKEIHTPCKIFTKRIPRYLEESDPLWRREEISIKVLSSGP